MSADCICIHLLQQTGEPLKKILPVLVIFENCFAFDSSNDDMMQGAAGVYAGHVFQMRDSCQLVNKETTFQIPFQTTLFIGNAATITYRDFMITPNDVGVRT